MDCRVETSVSPRNDDFGACHVTLVVIAKPFICGEYFYAFLTLGARRVFSTIRKFRNFLSKINIFIVIANGQRPCGDPHAENLK